MAHSDISHTIHLTSKSTLRSKSPLCTTSGRAGLNMCQLKRKSVLSVLTLRWSSLKMMVNLATKSKPSIHVFEFYGCVILALTYKSFRTLKYRQHFSITNHFMGVESCHSHNPESVLIFYFTRITTKFCVPSLARGSMYKIIIKYQHQYVLTAFRVE